MKHYNIPVFIPHLGCSHHCIFCNQKKITGQSEPCTPDSAKREIERYLSFLPNGTAEIAFFGGSFTAIPVHRQEAFLSLAQEYVKKGVVSGIRLSTRPDAVETETLERLRYYGVTTVELGVQSFCDEVLQKAGRGHTAACAVSACERVKAFGFALGVQLMCGLPGDTPERDLYSAEQAKRLADFVRLYPVLVLKDTPLEQLYQSGQYRPLSLEEAVDITAGMKVCLSPVPVIRTGLCTEDLEESDVVAGPIHPSFGELTQARIYDGQVRQWLDRQPSQGKTLIISAPKKEQSKLAGQKRTNILGWKKDFGLKNVRFSDGEKLAFSLKSE